MLVGTGGLAGIIQKFLIRRLKRRLLWKRLLDHHEEENEEL